VRLRRVLMLVRSTRSIVNNRRRGARAGRPKQTVRLHFFRFKAVRRHCRFGPKVGRVRTSLPTRSSVRVGFLEDGVSARVLLFSLFLNKLRPESTDVCVFVGNADLSFGLVGLEW